MEARTVSYVQTRFGDYYRRVDVPAIPEPTHREFGVIPWQTEPDPPMFRHNSVLDHGGSVDAMLAAREPRHAYFSAATYESPTTEPMQEKGWRGADLVFDLDADHLPEVDTNEDSYAERLSKCKDELMKLLSILDDDFGFDDTTVVFSGGRGYHVHIRDDHIRQIDDNARRDIVDHVLGIDIGLSDVAIRGRGNIAETGRKNLVLQHHGGWGRRVHRRLVDILNQIEEMDDSDAEEFLQRYDNIGEKKAESILAKMRDDGEAIRQGEVILGRSFKEFIRRLIPEAVEEGSAHIDEQVTKDVHRLIRIPESLHGGTALRVTPIARGDLASFDPLTDAVPEIFRGGDVEVTTTTEAEVGFDGNSYSIEPSTTRRVPEHVGMFLMAQGLAEKA